MRHRTRVYPSSAISLPKSATADLDAQTRNPEPHETSGFRVRASRTLGTTRCNKKKRPPRGRPFPDTDLNNRRSAVDDHLALVTIPIAIALLDDHGFIAAGLALA